MGCGMNGEVAAEVGIAEQKPPQCGRRVEMGRAVLRREVRRAPDGAELRREDDGEEQVGGAASGPIEETTQGRDDSTVRLSFVKLEEIVAAAAADGAGEAALKSFYEAALENPRGARLLMRGRGRRKVLEGLVRTADRHLPLTERHAGARVLAELLGPKVAQSVEGVKAQIEQINADEEQRVMRPGREEYPLQWLIDKQIDDMVKSLAPAVRVAYRAGSRAR